MRCSGLCCLEPGIRGPWPRPPSFRGKNESKDRLKSLAPVNRSCCRRMQAAGPFLASPSCACLSSANHAAGRSPKSGSDSTLLFTRWQARNRAATTVRRSALASSGGGECSLCCGGVLFVTMSSSTVVVRLRYWRTDYCPHPLSASGRSRRTIVLVDMHEFALPSAARNPPAIWSGTHMQEIPR